MDFPLDKESKFETILENGEFKLEKATGFELMDGAKSNRPNYHTFRLTKNTGEHLLRITCSIPFKGNLYEIGRVDSAKPGNINFLQEWLK